MLSAFVLMMVITATAVAVVSLSIPAQTQLGILEINLLVIFALPLAFSLAAGVFKTIIAVIIWRKKGYRPIFR